MGCTTTLPPGCVRRGGRRLYPAPIMPSPPGLFRLDITLAVYTCPYLQRETHIPELSGNNVFAPATLSSYCRGECPATGIIMQMLAPRSRNIIPAELYPHSQCGLLYHWPYAMAIFRAKYSHFGVAILRAKYYDLGVAIFRAKYFDYGMAVFRAK